MRPPAPGTYQPTGEALRVATQAGELFDDNNTASVLVEPAPAGDYLVETRVRLDVPPEGCCYNYAQAGLVIYGNDDNYVKLAHVSIFETRQTEFAKEVGPVPDRYPRYGGSVVGPPDEWTWLRIVKRTAGDEELYTAYTSRDGTTWVRGGTWTHTFGESARIGLVAMGGRASPPTSTTCGSTPSSPASDCGVRSAERGQVSVPLSAASRQRSGAGGASPGRGNRARRGGR